jgi:hypothetical protein
MRHHKCAPNPFRHRAPVNEHTLMDCGKENFFFSTLESLSQDRKDLRKVFVLFFLVARSEPASIPACHWCISADARMKIDAAGRCGSDFSGRRPSRVELNQPRLRSREFAFPRNALMRLVGALDPIFILAIARKVLNHLVNTTRHKPTDCRVERYKFSNLEFVRAHIRRPLLLQRQLFDFERTSSRISRNSPGPLRSRRFRCCRSSAETDGSLSLSICAPAKSSALDLALGLRALGGRDPARAGPSNRRMASGRDS